jgi:hypothetical protein
MNVEFVITVAEIEELEIAPPLDIVDMFSNLESDTVTEPSAPIAEFMVAFENVELVTVNGWLGYETMK